MLLPSHLSILNFPWLLLPGHCLGETGLTPVEISTLWGLYLKGPPFRSIPCENLENITHQVTQVWVIATQPLGMLEINFSKRDVGW